MLIPTLGGIAAFGLSGFVIGPVVAALFIAIWDIFSASRQNDMSASVNKTECLSLPLCLEDRRAPLSRYSLAWVAANLSTDIGRAWHPSGRFFAIRLSQ